MSLNKISSFTIFWSVNLGKIRFVHIVNITTEYTIISIINHINVINIWVKMFNIFKSHGCFLFVFSNNKITKYFKITSVVSQYFFSRFMRIQAINKNFIIWCRYFEKPNRNYVIIIFFSSVLKSLSLVYFIFFFFSSNYISFFIQCILFYCSFSIYFILLFFIIIHLFLFTLFWFIA